jgi:small subunit ribosomal protein S13
MEKQRTDKENEERMVRVLATDIEGKMTIYSGLAKIKGVSWALSNAICKTLKLNKKRKIGSITEKEIEEISKIIKEGKIPKFLLNRQNDFESGEDKHLTGSDLELRKEFDIKRLKKIKSYKGLRHSSNLPMRGQRTKSNFRRNRRKGAGIKKKNKKEK